jgi:hypothetical protein
MINHKHKFIFIHIPKTGGTSIEAMFDPKAPSRDVQYKHWSLSDYFEQKEYISEYFSFSFVRNPWSLTVSMYNYLWHSNYNFPKVSRSNPKYKFIFNLSFKDFILHQKFQSGTLKSGDIFSDKINTKNLFQLDFVTHNNKLVDFIGKFENLQQDFDTICEKIGIARQELPHENKTNRKHYTEYYDNETREIVAQKYAKDIEYFGYKFGE